MLRFIGLVVVVSLWIYAMDLAANVANAPIAFSIGLALVVAIVATAAAGTIIYQLLFKGIAL